MVRDPNYLAGQAAMAGKIENFLLERLLLTAEDAREDAQRRFDARALCTLHQLEAMRVLEARRLIMENTTATDLARCLGCSKATMSEMLRGLTKNGWLVKHATFSDRRARLLQVSDHGRVVSSECREELADLAKDHFEPLGAEQKLTLAKMLAALVAARRE
jgi:DNA-binding MarR family transcriptional regulator